MELSEYDRIFEQEESHFYYRATHKLITQIVSDESSRLKRHSALRTSNLDLAAPASSKDSPHNSRSSQPLEDSRLPTPLRILDAGCGTGGLAKILGEWGDVEGIDLHERACDLAAQRGVHVQKASIADIPFPDASFDIVTSVDVLYHQNVADDAKAIKEIARVLKPSGIAIIKVPANPWLRSAHDQHVHTRQRYSRKELATKLRDAHLRIVKIAPTNPSLFVAAFGRHWLEKLRPSRHASGVRSLPQGLNSLIYSWLCAENFLTLHARLPFGLGLIAVAEKVEDIRI